MTTKYYGAVGYGYTEQKPDDPDVWEEVLVERNYYGDLKRDTSRWVNGEHLNDNLVVNNLISIVADAFALDHFFAIRYAWWMGARWKVTHVEVQPPRLILTLGGVYNGPRPEGTGEDS